METGQRKGTAAKAEQKAPRTANGLGFQRPKILIARQRRPYATGGFGFKGVQVLVTQMDREETGEGFKTAAERKRPGEGRLVTEIKIIIERMLSEGKSLSKILQDSKLSKEERRVFYAYVWRKNHITQEEAAKKLGTSKVTLTHMLRFIANKLLGRDVHYHRIKKYVDLSDNELEKKIRESGAKSKGEFGRKNFGLHRVAKERGILDRMFPSPILKELRDALEAALKKRSLERILAGSEALDRIIINEIALSKAPPSIKSFARKHGLKPDKVSRRMKKLTAELKGEKVNNDIAADKLKRCVKDLDGDRLEELKSLLDERELAILKRRATAKVRESLDSIGKSFSVTRQRMKQKEDELLRKIERWERGGTFGRKKPEWPRIKRIKKMVEERRLKGESIEEIKRDAGLSGIEGHVTDLCVLDENRLTQKEAAGKLGTTPSTISKILKSVEDKLISTEKEIS